MADNTSGTGWPEGDSAHKAQARTEKIALPGKVTLRGRDFALGPFAGENLMALLEFSAAQDSGLTSSDPAGMAAMLDWLRFCFVKTPACGGCEACEAEDYFKCGSLDEGEWPAFRRRARALCATGDEIYGCLNAALEQIAARPTSKPGGSSSPGSTSSPKSREASSSPADVPLGNLPPAFQRAFDAGDMIDVQGTLQSAG